MHLVPVDDGVEPEHMSARAAPSAGSRSGGPELGLSVAAVAADLGIAPATLRTWDRRYGLGPAEHATGSHRRYRPLDVARLRLMKRGVLHGASPADAARYAQEVDPVVLSSLVAVRDLPAGPGDAFASAAPRDSDDKLMPYFEQGSPAQELAVAALALDTRVMQRQLRGLLAEHGVAYTWDLVIRPVLAAVGDRWAGTGAGVEVEHVLSECVAAVLSHLMIEAPTSTGDAPVLLACMPGEDHDLPLRVLGAALTEQARPLVMLGADTPVPALIAAVQARKPLAVFLWAQMDRSADPHLLDRLPPSRYILGGPAWDQTTLPADVQPVRHLAEALEVLQSAKDKSAGWSHLTRPGD